MIALLALILALSGPVLAQSQYQGQGGGPQPGMQGPHDNPSGGSGDSVDNAPPPDDSGAASDGGSMNLEDARMNFGTVIDAFVAERTVNGYWPLKEKATGNVLHLKLVSKDTKSIKDAGGSRFYSGRVSLRDLVSGDTIKADFVVDFSGSEWKVKSMKITGKVSAKKKKGADQPQGPPADDAPQN